jgi:serine/threonine-protein kinase
LLEEVGRGGMAVVFRAHDERLGREVAVKTLAPALAADEGFRHRFLRESVAAAAVDDPHIIPVFEAGEAGGVLFMAMRLVRGGDVGSLLHRVGVLAPWRAAALLSPVAAALDAAHAAGLVHRDVKPGNMLLDVRDGRPDHVYLADFGLSRSTLAATGLTGSGQFLGTLDYVPPEQIEGGSVDGREDQYSLACTAFEMLAGSPPFHRGGGMAVMYAQMSQPAPLLSSQSPGAPRAADAVLARAMSKVSADRYATCRQFTDALRAALGIGPYDPADGAGSTQGHPVTEVAGVPSPVPADTGALHSPVLDSRATVATFLAGHAVGKRNPAADAGDHPGAASLSSGRRRRGVLAALLAVAVACAGAALLASWPGATALPRAASLRTSSKPALAGRPRPGGRATLARRSPPAAALAGMLASAGLRMSSVTVFTAATDPNHLLGREGGYISKVEWVDPAAVSAGAGRPTSDDRFDTSFGGSIEVYPSSAGAQARDRYLKVIAKADPALADGYDYVAGTAILRLSGYLTPAQARRYHAAFDRTANR